MKQHKDSGTAYLLWLLSLVGIAGIHHFYLDRPVKGIIWLLTGGLFLFGTIWDLFTLGSQTEDVNRAIDLDNVKTLHFIDNQRRS